MKNYKELTLNTSLILVSLSQVRNGIVNETNGLKTPFFRAIDKENSLAVSLLLWQIQPVFLSFLIKISTTLLVREFSSYCFVGNVFCVSYSSY